MKKEKKTKLPSKKSVEEMMKEDYEKWKKKTEEQFDEED